jgi:ubiquinone/menaquinone biosynthesis C-methylase UbiE
MKEYIKINQRVYDALAGEYRQKLKDYIISDKKIASPFIKYLKNHFDRIKVLELGPGSGLNLSYFESEGFDTTAIDVSKEILRVSKEMSPETKYIFGDFLTFDFGKLKFEGIFAKAFVHLFTKKDAAIVLKKIFDYKIWTAIIIFILFLIYSFYG